MGDTRPPGPPNTTSFEKDQSTGEQEEEEEEKEEHDFFQSTPQFHAQGCNKSFRGNPPHSDIQPIYSSPRTLGLMGDTRPPGPPNTTSLEKDQSTGEQEEERDFFQSMPQFHAQGCNKSFRGNPPHSDIYNKSTVVPERWALWVIRGPRAPPVLLD